MYDLWKEVLQNAKCWFVFSDLAAQRTGWQSQAIFKQLAALIWYTNADIQMQAVAW